MSIIKRLFPLLALAACILISDLSLAGPMVEVKNPLGRTMQAEKITNPAAGTIEHAIIESMKMIKAGQFDQWMNTWCHPDRCPDTPSARESMRRYNLKSSQPSIHHCMQDDQTSILVTRRDEPDAQGRQTVYIFCGETRMPAPSTLVQVDGKWLVTSFSW